MSDEDRVKKAIRELSEQGIYPAMSPEDLERAMNQSFVIRTWWDKASGRYRQEVIDPYEPAKP